MPEPSSSEPEKYTIDEMMDRLKGRNSSEDQPELVTRSDGSQAMKLKKRRRRTNQAVNEETKRNQRVHVAQIAGFVILVVLLGLAVGISIIYANSSSFRESLIAKFEDASGAKVSLIQFRMNPATANANKVVMEWPEGNPLGRLEVISAVAKIAPASFIGKAFSGEEIVGDKGQLVLRAPSEGAASRGSPKSEGEAPVNFSRYSIPFLDIQFGEKAGSRRALKGSEVSIFSSSASGQAEIRLRGGLLEFDAWPPMQLDRSYIKVRNASFQIKSMRFVVPKSPSQRSDDEGFVDFSGTIRPLESGTSHTLEAKVQELRLPYLIGADLGRFFLGTVDSKEIPDSNSLTFSPDSPESSTLELTLTNSLGSRIDLGGFKFLSQLSVALDDRWYEFPNFEDTVTLVVRRRSGEVEMSGINIVNGGRMAIQGSIWNGEGGVITGKLRVGLPETTIAAAPNKRLNLMFGRVREGFRWIDLEVGGTTALPVDNFKDLYTKAAETPAAEPAEKEGDPDNFENLIDGGE
ncbi:MAG: hypothetical protein OSA84_05875 [Akkermansiaceae bacterium]|nr:hypothetical protein [Akkermansiaceae bacterium]